jgi:hypothetical protein
VPLNKDVNEVPELIRYFESDPTGQAIAQNMAENGRNWANKVLRKEDMEVYMFRLFLEYVTSPCHFESRLTVQKICSSTG